MTASVTGVPPWQSRTLACQHSASLCRHNMSTSPISSKITSPIISKATRPLWNQRLQTHHLSADPPPPELSSFETFKTDLRSLYGDPNLAASAEREICRLRQTSAVANYAAKFEEHRQYLEWNDAALRDQFYRGLKDEIKDELAPLGRPATLAKLKELATRLDSRLQERALERRQAYPT